MKKNYPLSGKRDATFFAACRAVLLMIAVFCFTTSLSAQTKDITLKFSEIPLSEAIKIVEKNTDYVFFYSNSDINITKKTSVDIKNGTIQEVLTQLIPEYKYKIEKNKIVILSATNSQPASQSDTKKTVTGTVTDDKGVIVGAGVIEKGTNNQTITNIDGKFSINVSANATLVISYIGYITQEISVANKSDLKVTLQSDLKLLNEVVVIGYGSVKKSDLTGSVTSVTAKSLPSSPAASVDGLLQGKVAGLQVTQNSGEPGSGFEIKLRGVSSRQGSNSPLYVVDGFPYGDAGALKQVNVSDIASIEVLKDASAASIYGSRGANGVIIITTKSGAMGGKAKVSANANVGIQRVNTSNFGIIKDPYTYAVLADEARINDSRIGVPRYIGANDETGFYYPSLTELSSGAWNRTTDWEKEILKIARVQNYNVAVSGGGPNNAYMFSASHFGQDGTLIGNDYKSYSTRFKFDQKAFESLKVGTNLSFSYVSQNPANIGFGNLFRNPVFPVYQEDGSYYKEGPTDFYNPVMLANELTHETDAYDLFMVAYADWNVSKQINIRAQSGLKYGSSVADKYYPRTTNLGNIHNGRGEIENFMGTVWLNEAYATYKNVFADKHAVSAMFGYTSEITNNRGSGLVAVGFANDNLRNENMSMGDPEKNLLSNYKNKQVLSSYISRVNYTYDDRYLITFTGRYDGSSKFGTNNKYAFFPSVAIGWKIIQESFLRDKVSWLSELKLRASYGSTGN